MNVMDKQWEKALTKLNEKEQKFFRNIKKYLLDIGYNKILKPILIGIATFWIFNKLKTRLGLEDTIFIILIVIILYLRSISTKLGE